ncbi:MAG: 1-acylglycerol-3-phosphate O-acyltransferase [Shewanellaceae bacterium]|nr:1-acylglycerol-3-phosphate O-acyltransferase [Shewanellaceae bacterium]
MICILRALILFVVAVLGLIFAIVYCIIRPKYENHVFIYARILSFLAPLIGIKVVLRGFERKRAPCIFTANHQNSFDVFTLTKAVPKATVSLGKKSLLWMPLFGQIYWLTGNILIDRTNRVNSLQTLKKVVKKIKTRMLSVWFFPEGTRSNGRGLLPFKMGAFHTAIQAKVPIVPVVASCQRKIRWNHWNNGVVIVEILKPITTQSLHSDDVKLLAAGVHQNMLEAFQRLSKEARQLEVAH